MWSVKLRYSCHRFFLARPRCGLSVLYALYVLIQAHTPEFMLYVHAIPPASKISSGQKSDLPGITALDFLPVYKSLQEI